MLLGGLRAATHDPGERGVSAALSECLVAYELLQLQRKQQSQLMLNAAFHPDRACKPETRDRVLELLAFAAAHAAPEPAPAQADG